MDEFKAWIVAHPEYNGLRHTYGDALFNHDNGVFRVRALRLAYEVYTLTSASLPRNIPRKET